MLETYGPDGLLYIPFAAMRHLTFLPPRNFIDRLVARADVELADGQTTTVLVPLLYALSTTADEDGIRAGRMTTFRYVGSARRALVQRDFVLDGGRMIGMQSVAALEITTADAPAIISNPPRPQYNPLPEARIAASGGANRRALLGVLLLAALVILVLLLLR